VGDRKVGSIGDFTCFSLYATKSLAGGEGALALLEVGARVRGAFGDTLADRDRGLALGQLLLAAGQPRLALGEHDLGLLL
jgi:hypothetical protein